MFTERFVVEAFPSVDCPVTERVPFEVKDEVAVILPNDALPPVNEEIVAVTALRSVVKKFVDVALVVVRLVMVVVANVVVPTIRNVPFARRFPFGLA